MCNICTCGSSGLGHAVPRVEMSCGVKSSFLCTPPCSTWPQQIHAGSPGKENVMRSVLQRARISRVLAVCLAVTICLSARLAVASVGDPAGPDPFYISFDEY